MASNTVAQFAAELKMPVQLLLDQLKSAGVEKLAAEDTLSAGDKAKLLEGLQKAHGSESGEKKRITITRKQTTEIKQADATGKARTIQVEVRKKRVLVKRDTPDAAPEVAAPVESIISEQEAKRREEEARRQAELVARQEAEARARQEAEERANRAAEQAMAAAQATMAAAEDTASEQDKAAAAARAEKEQAAQAAKAAEEAKLKAAKTAEQDALKRRDDARRRADAEVAGIRQLMAAPKKVV
ncbi:MAG: hypothetical protein RL341_380, partial [Pseudomonadota bacterium]